MPPLPGRADKVTGVPWHTGLAEGVTETLTCWLGLTVRVTWFDTAGLPEMQDAPDVISQTTKSPLEGTMENTGLFDPALAPFTFHWYTGDVPPFWGAALNITWVPWHTGLDEAAIKIPVCCNGFTIIVTGAETT